MLKRKIYLGFLSVTIFFLFTSCDFLLNLFKTENPEYEIGKFEDINIFDKSNLSEENSFVTGYSITGDNEYLYAATTGKTKCPGKIVKVSKNGEEILIKELQEEALKKNYDNAHAYWLDSINYYKNKLLIISFPKLLQFENGEFEIYCVNPDDLTVDWRWTPDENGMIEICKTGNRTIAFWKDYYLIFYACEKTEGFYIALLDSKGNQILKRYTKHSCPTEDGDICIVNDKLILHQYSNPLVVYDLNKLTDDTYDFDDCIDYSFDTGSANIYSNIVFDGENCYFCYWDKINSSYNELFVDAVSLTDYRILWTYRLSDKFFNGVNSIALNDGHLFLAADAGCVYNIDTSSGKLTWKKEITTRENFRNLLNEGVFYKNYFVLPCSDDYLYYFDMRTGEVKGKKCIPFVSRTRCMYVEDEYLYIATGSYIVKLKLLE